MKIRRGAAAFVVAAAFAGSYAAPAAAVIDTSDRTEVERAFLDDVLPALETPIGWTGSTSACDPGAPSAEARAATLTTLNYVRALAGLDPVSFDPALSAAAQKAALMMDANDDLDHTPPPGWKCWSQEGADAAGSSNLHLGVSGAAAIVGYMGDAGGGNEVVGHRRWILRPETATMGTGSTSDADALWVFGEDDPGAAAPEWVPWPTAGYFPSPLEPGGRWSLTASADDVTFAGATVTVTDATGYPLPVQTYPPEEGFGDNTLVWEVSGIELPRGPQEEVYTVRVSNIGRSGGAPALEHSYQVKLASPPLTPVAPPSIAGRARVGKTLTADVGAWEPDPDAYSFQWLRAGTAIAGATDATYRLTRRDKGTTISVRVVARRHAFADGTATSAETKKVRARR